MKTIYISGKIDGCSGHYVSLKFAEAQTRVVRLLKARGEEEWSYPTVINPTTLPEIPGGTWEEYMMRDLLYLMRCDAIYMLGDWRESHGATIEHEFAKKLGLEIIYEEKCGTIEH